MLLTGEIKNRKSPKMGLYNFKDRALISFCEIELAEKLCERIKEKDEHFMHCINGLEWLLWWLDTKAMNRTAILPADLNIGYRLFVDGIDKRASLHSRQYIVRCKCLIPTSFFSFALQVSCWLHAIAFVTQDEQHGGFAFEKTLGECCNG